MLESANGASGATGAAGARGMIDATGVQQVLKVNFYKEIHPQFSFFRRRFL